MWTKGRLSRLVLNLADDKTSDSTDFILWEPTGEKVRQTGGADDVDSFLGAEKQDALLLSLCRVLDFRES